MREINFIGNLGLDLLLTSLDPDLQCKEFDVVNGGAQFILDAAVYTVVVGVNF